MFLFRYECRVDPQGRLATDQAFQQIGGAYVNVWVKFKHFPGAEVLSRFYAQQAGWTIEHKQGAWKVKKSKSRKKDRHLIAEAAKYGYTTASHMWYKNAPDADQDRAPEHDDTPAG